jgi:hypothetical protein
MDPSISPATALKSAVSHLDHANDRLLRAVSGVSGEDPANALADQLQARTEIRASIGVIRMSDEMTKELLNIGHPP